MNRQEVLCLIAQFSAAQLRTPTCDVVVCADDPDHRGHVVLVGANGIRHHVKAQQTHAPWFKPQLGSAHRASFGEDGQPRLIDPNGNLADRGLKDPETLDQPKATVRIAGCSEEVREALGFASAKETTAAWSLERWDCWAMDLLGLEGYVSQHGRLYMRKKIERLISSGQLRAQFKETNMTPDELERWSEQVSGAQASDEDTIIGDKHVSWDGVQAYPMGDCTLELRKPETVASSISFDDAQPATTVTFSAGPPGEPITRTQTWAVVSAAEGDGVGVDWYCIGCGPGLTRPDYDDAHESTEPPHAGLWIWEGTFIRVPGGDGGLEGQYRRPTYDELARIADGLPALGSS